jgi:hypothetical protein
MNSGWIGGLRERANPTWPMCRLRMDEQGIVLEPSSPLFAWLLPVYRIPWASVATVSATHGTFGSIGIRFSLVAPVAAARRAGAAVLWPELATHPIFWCSRRQRDEILASVPNGSLVRPDVT